MPICLILSVLLSTMPRTAPAPDFTYELDEESVIAILEVRELALIPAGLGGNHVRQDHLLDVRYDLLETLKGEISEPWPAVMPNFVYCNEQSTVATSIMAGRPLIHTGDILLVRLKPSVFYGLNVWIMKLARLLPEGQDRNGELVMPAMGRPRVREDCSCEDRAGEIINDMVGRELRGTGMTLGEVIEQIVE